MSLNGCHRAMLPKKRRPIMSRLNFINGNVETMDKDTIYVDGSYKGFEVHLKQNAFSFDHHASGRFAMSSATYQVCCAIAQGLDPSDTTIVVNHTDADSVLGVMFLLNPGWVTKDIMPQIERLSRLDNHGPAAAMVGEATQGYHFALRPDRGETDSYDIFMSRLGKAMKMFEEGTLWDESPARKLPGRAVGFDTNGIVLDTGWKEAVSFDDIYANAGFGVIFGEKGTVTIGKKPFFRCPAFNSEGKRNKAGLIKRLNSLEEGWGGADSIMGSPRPNGTKLEQQVILDTISKFI